MLTLLLLCAGVKNAALANDERPVVATAVPTAAEISPAGDGSLNLQALKGRVVYLDFWASWCGPCRQSFPWMAEMQQRYAGQGFVVVAVNLDKDHELAAGFLREFRPRFPIVYDKTAKLAEQFHVSAMPYSVVLDRDGKVKAVHTGFGNERRAAMEDEIRQLMN